MVLGNGVDEVASPFGFVYLSARQARNRVTEQTPRVSQIDHINPTFPFPIPKIYPIFNPLKCNTKLKPGFVYMLTNKNNTTLYVGVTSEIVKRIKDHKEKKYPRSFTSRYNLDKLVYYEVLRSMSATIGREKQLKAGSRAKKLALIESVNPDWRDLYGEVLERFGNAR